ncbi:MAG: hypothetical protein WAM96_21700 [Candidatus Acidiferrales bacterium]
MRRRDFIQLAAGNLAWFGLGVFRMDALKLRSALRPVMLHAQIGNLFPPLELVHRIRNSGHTNAQLLMVSKSSEPELPGARGPRTIHLGFRMTELDPREHQGNLQRSAQEAVMRRIGIVLEERFQYHAVKTTLDPSPAFWYPYLGTTAGNLVFCRLVVEDSLVAEAA